MEPTGQVQYLNIWEFICKCFGDHFWNGILAALDCVIGFPLRGTCLH